MSTTKTSWKAARDPLYRGSDVGSPGNPNPTANRSLVRHILYLDGCGRDTPYLSNAELWKTAEHFAGSAGAVWRTTVRDAEAQGVRHISRKELLTLLWGGGKGDAAWPNAFEVSQARRYAEQHGEHLYDFGAVDADHAADVAHAAYERD